MWRCRNAGLRAAVRGAFNVHDDDGWHLAFVCSVQNLAFTVVLCLIVYTWIV